MSNVGDTLRALIHDEDGNEVNPDDVDAEIQWSADGVEITDATDAEYTVLVGDVGVVLSVEVTIGDETYTAETEKVEPAEEPVEELTVSIDNTTPKVGDILTASVLPAEATNLTYAWYTGDTAASCTTLVADATTNTLTVDETMVGKFIKVQVTGEGSSSATAVTKEAVPDVVTVVALKSAVQTSASGLNLTFDQAASDKVKKEDIIVEDEDGTLVIPVNSVSFSEDGTAADIVLSASLKDGHSYKVSYGDSYVAGIVASVGAVKTIVIKTDKAEVNTKTKIEFELYDDKNVDVTSTQNIDATCVVTVTGDATYDVSKPSDASLTMTEKDAKATVKVVYNSGEKDAADISSEAVVTCVAATETIGTPMYAENPAVNANSSCAKFYKAGTAQTAPVSVEVGESEPDVYFCAVDENGDAIAYDSYDATSSNDDVAGVSITVDTGKYAQLTVSGNTEGTANIVLTATKNGVDTPYTIPVTVTKEGKLDSISVAVDKSKITNALDSDYYGKITVTCKDTNGNDITSDCNISTETVNAEKKEGLVVKEAYGLASGYSASNTDEQNLAAARLSGFGFYTVGSVYTAWCAQGGSQNIKVSVSQDDIVREKTVGVTVDALPATIWNSDSNTNKTPAKMTYSVVLDSNTIDEKASSTGVVEARLAAYAGSKFAGYVRQNEDGLVSIGNSFAVVADGAHAVAKSSEGGLEFTANDAGADWNGYEFVVLAGRDGVDEVEAVKEVKIKGSEKIYFEAVPGGAAAGEAGNDWAITLNNKLGNGTKGVYKLEFTGNWTVGDSFDFDKNTFVADETVEDDRTAATAFAKWVNDNYKGIYTAKANNKDVTITQEYPSTTENLAKADKKTLDVTYASATFTETNPTPPVEPGTQGTKGQFTVTFDKTWNVGDTVLFDGEVFEVNEDVVKSAEATAEAFKDWVGTNATVKANYTATVAGDIVTLTQKVPSTSLHIDNIEISSANGNITKATNTEPEDPDNTATPPVTGTAGEWNIRFTGSWADGDTITLDGTQFQVPATVTAIDKDDVAAGFAAWINKNDAFKGIYWNDAPAATVVAVDGTVHNQVNINQLVASKTEHIAEVEAVNTKGTAGAWTVTFANNWTEGDTIKFDAKNTFTASEDVATAEDAAEEFTAWTNSTYDGKFTAELDDTGLIVTITQVTASEANDKVTFTATAADTLGDGTIVVANPTLPADPGTAVAAVEKAPTSPVTESVVLDEEEQTITINAAADGKTAEYVANLWNDKADEATKALFEISDATEEVLGADAIEAIEPGVEYHATGLEPLGSKGIITYTYSETVAKVTDPDLQLLEAALEYGIFARDYEESDIPSAFGISDGVVEPYGEISVISEGGTGATTLGSPVLATAETRIEDGTIVQGVKMGTTYSTTGLLFNSDVNVKASKDDLSTYGTIFVIDAINNDAVPFYVSKDPSKDGVFAKTGAYTVTFNYKVNNKDASATTNLTVKNSLYIPKVTVTKRVVDALAPSSIVEVLKADVDMNNNNSAYASIDDSGMYSDVYVDGTTKEAEENNGKLTVKYVGVVEDGVMVFVPINATFRTE